MDVLTAGRRMGTFALVALALAGAAFAVAAGPARAAGDTVHITGKTFRFGKRAPVLVGAVIKVREFPGISTVSDANGDYDLEVPDNANVTPYIVTGWNAPATDAATQHYNEIDLQTFHTRGENIENANFQTPTDLEYNALKAILGVPADAEGRPAQCVIVTTSSARNVRDVSYDTYWDRTPHGVAGATSRTVPAVPGPIYFNNSVIPDPTWTSSSHDGGIIWSVVPTGTYRVITEHPTTRFASFLATCEPGRVVNANPPWGAYELAPGESPLGASNVAAKVEKAKATRKGKRNRTVAVTVRTGETIGFAATVRKAGKVVATKKVKALAGGTRTVKIPVKAKVKPGQANVRVTLTDAADVSFGSSHKVKLPKVAKKKR
ncbi:MAG TPA: hypothetical protein VMF31_05080 [Solirubrobacterales bacterium]|nr:hypothetical protein [Solirubrobacterales bacterium]